ncbi:MAG TPA: hypothetical protein VMR66_02265 [Gemmatimonadota bacterium]|nr:hypothetical protein [Gemmatimonadota bacterium]
MMRLMALRAACLGGALVIALAAPGLSQEDPVSLLDWRPEAEPGPTRAEARAATAGSLLRPSVQVSILSRYDEFQRDFDGDFGVQGLTNDREGDVLEDLRSRLDARWGDATMYQWIERGLALYARVQASTQIRRKGFDMEVDVDDVSDGKLGVRVQRALE